MAKKTQVVMDEAVNQYVAASLSTSTRHAYENDLKHFINWGGTIPSTPEQVASYLAQHAKLAVTSLARRLTAIERAHSASGHLSPSKSAIVRATLQGIRRSVRHEVRQVAPLQKATLIKMLSSMDGLRGLRDAALLLVGFAGAFRRSELVSLQVEDVRFVPEGMLIRLSRSKTDQEGMGRVIAIPSVKGRNCPVQRLKSWLTASEITEGPIFRRIDRHECVHTKPLSGQSVALIIKSYVDRLGLDAAQFSGHSLRAGFVTNASQRGASSTSIRAQTGHKSDSMMQRYIRNAQLFTDNPVSKVW
jgi:site-specific recombinase XerD